MSTVLTIKKNGIKTWKISQYYSHKSDWTYLWKNEYLIHLTKYNRSERNYVLNWL